jgi:hypothetical protein
MGNTFKKIMKFVMLPFFSDLKTYLRIYFLILKLLPTMLYNKNISILREEIGKINFTYKIFGEKITLPGKTFFGFAEEIYIRKCYFPNSNFQIKKGMVVFDLGANIGIVSILAAKLGARVFAIEMEKELCEEILKNAKTNKCEDKIKIINGAVGYQKDNKINTLSLDKILEENNINNIDFMKIDIEGAEFGLFKETIWLERTKKIVMEVHPPQVTPEYIKEILLNNNYQVNYSEVIDPGGSSTSYLFANK